MCAVLEDSDLAVFDRLRRANSPLSNGKPKDGVVVRRLSVMADIDGHAGGDYRVSFTVGPRRQCGCNCQTLRVVPGSR